MARKQYGVAASAAADLVTRTDASKVPPLKNYLLNSACMIAQEFGSTAQTGVVANRYPIDGILYGAVGAPTAAFTLQQVALNTPGGSPNRLRATVTTAQATMAAGDTILIEPGRLDGLDIADLLMGTANAKAFVVRFGFKGPAGTYGLHLRNAVRFYTTSFTISAGQANTDTVQSFLIPGDTTGTWLNTEGTLGLLVTIALACGTTFQTSSLNSWSASASLAPNTITNNVATVGNVFEVFDTGLYASTVVPDFVVPDYVTEQRRCMRYFQSYPVAGGTTPTSGLNSMGLSIASSTVAVLEYLFPVPMRVTPTITIANTTTTNCSVGTGAAGCDKSKVRFNVTAAAAGSIIATWTWTANARV